MAKDYGEGARVEWNWGAGTGSGKIEKVHTRKRIGKIACTGVTPDASEDQPTCKMVQDDGDTVLKSHSELRKA